MAAPRRRLDGRGRPGRGPQVRRRSDSALHRGPRPLHRKISSTNFEAQAFFDQGFQMMYTFAKLDAVRSFREAWKRDPSCAICYWGEGWAWGSYLNGPMIAEQAPFAYAAAQKALAMKDTATPLERAFIEALAVRYVKDFDPKTRMDQDKAYAEAMRKLAEAVSRRSRRRHALRRRALPDGAAPRHPRPRRPEHAAAARRARARAGQGHQASRRLPPLRARHRVDREAREGGGLRRVPRQRRCLAPAT